MFSLLNWFSRWASQILTCHWLAFPPIRNCCLVTQDSSNQSDPCLYLATVTHVPKRWLGDDSVYLSLLAHVIGWAILVQIYKHNRDFVDVLRQRGRERERGYMGLLYTQVNHGKQIAKTYCGYSLAYEDSSWRSIRYLAVWKSCLNI